MTSDPDVGLRVVKETTTLRELTAQKLREAILAGVLKPRQRLVERELCAQTGVSRSSLREALRHLEAEGLVERRDAGGLFVAALSADEARQIYEVRAAIEAAMGRRFAERASERDRAALQTALAALVGAIEGPIRDYVNALDRFYDVLLAGSGNAVAERILATLRARITYLRTITTARADPARRRETLELMRGIAEAALRRDGDAVARRCAAFVERSAAFAIAVLGEEGEAAPRR